MSQSLESAKVLLAAYKDHATIVNSLWNIFQIVSLGLVGLVYKDEQVRSNWRMLILVSVGFLAFAIGNQEAIMRSQDVIYAASTQMAQVAKMDSADPHVQPVLSAHRAPSSNDLRKGHWVFTAAVILAIWIPLAIGAWRKSVSAK